MNLEREGKRYWERIMSGAERVNAQGDIIVPDVKPDILKVLEIDARSVVKDKGIVAGGMYAEGKVYVTILYVADGDEETGCIKTELDFIMKLDNAAIKQEMKLKLSSDVVKIDFILLNSRKLSVKSTVGISYEIIGEKGLEFPREVEGCGESQEEKLNIETIGAMEEYGYTVRGSLEVPAGKASVKEIIKADVEVIEREIKPVASKLIVNGKLGVCVLYFTEDMKVEYCEGEIPFTEVFGSEEITEEDYCCADFEIGDIDTELCADSDGDIRVISLECFALMGVKVNRAEEVNYISDCYCAGCETEIAREEKEVREFVDFIVKETNERKLIEPDGNNPKICKIYNVMAEEEVLRCEVLDGGVKVSGRIKLYILYLTDNEKCPVYSMKKDLEFEDFVESADAREGMTCDARVFAQNLQYNINSNGNIEIKFAKKYEIRVTKKVNVKLICGVETKEKEEENDIVIYFIKKGDSLWSIGKNYGVRVNDIMELNSLESDEIREGQKLLIPVS